MSSLIETLSSAIELQRLQKEKDFKEKMTKPLSERVAKGHTLANLSIEVEFHEGQPNQWCPIVRPRKFIDTVVVHCKDNASRLREGSPVSLTYGDKYAFEMSVKKDGIDYMVLESGDFNVKSNYLPIDYPREGWEVNEINLSITERLLSATRDYIRSDSNISSNMEDLLAGKFANTYSSVRVQRTDNASQDEAIRRSLGCSSFHLVQGPPGTGKTFTIARLVKILLEQDSRVFVTGPTHTAINNILNAISKEVADKDKLVKIGEKYQAEEILSNPHITRKSRLSYFDYENSDLSKFGIVIGATPYSLCYPASKKLHGWTFEYVIIDEAAQMSIPLALAAMCHGSKLIFVGDHMQLDPIMPSGTKNWLFSKSIFKHLVDCYPNDITMLNLSYRLSPSLVRIPGALFYDSQLISKVSDSKEFVDFSCDEYSEILLNQSNEVLYVHHEFDALGRSPFEARICASLVHSLLDNDVVLDDIAIMSPYRAQVREVKKALVNDGVVAEDELDNVFVDTIERMQGQEKKYIIFSMANSNPAEVEDRLDFFYSANRLNVAITRAKTKCIVLANEKVFKICEDNLSRNAVSGSLERGMRAYLDYFNESTKVYATSSDEW